MHGRLPSRLLLRLILSYAAVAFTTIAFTGIGIFWAFLNRYNHEIEALETKLVEHTADAIHAGFVEPARSLYYELASDELVEDELSFFVSNPVEGNHYRIIGVWYQLRDAIEPLGEGVRAIAMHFRENRFSISSRSGVKFDVSDPFYDLLETTDDSTRTAAMAGFWRVRGESIQYVRQYPFTVDSSAPALMTISIPREQLAATIRDLSAEHADFFLTTADSGIVTPTDRSSVSSDTFLGQPVSVPSPEGGSDVIELDETSYVLTTSPIRGTSFHLGKLTSVNDFYERSRATRNILVIISVSALSVCLFLSIILARNQYDPVARIAHIVTGMVSDRGDEAESSTDVDFAQMVRGLTQLSDEVSELRSSVAANRPLLRHHLVRSTLFGSMSSEAELQRRLRLLGLARPVASCQAIYLRFHAKQLAGYEIEERSAVMYHTIDRVAELGGSHLALASELGDDRLGILVLGSQPLGSSGTHLASTVSDFLRNQFGIVHWIGIGRTTSSPKTCSISYHEAEEAARSAFFLDRAVVDAAKVDAAPQPDADIPHAHRKTIVEALHERDRTLVERTLREVSEEFHTGHYPAHSCRLYLAAIISDITTYAERVEHTFLPGEYRCLQAFEDEFVGLREFVDWLVRLVSSVFESVEGAARDTRLIRIRRIQDYIQRHLQEPISLESIADEFHITPSTLSRDFKNLCGVNFVEFIRESRLVRAQELLRDTRLSVKQIAAQSGYNSSSYFIQQFRRQFGITPAQYRQSIAAAARA